MRNNRNLFYYLSAVALFIVLKAAFSMASVSDLLFLLRPTNSIVSLLADAPSVFFRRQRLLPSKSKYSNR